MPIIEAKRGDLVKIPDSLYKRFNTEIRRALAKHAQRDPSNPKFGFEQVRLWAMEPTVYDENLAALEYLIPLGGDLILEQEVIDMRKDLILDDLRKVEGAEGLIGKKSVIVVMHYGRSTFGSL